MKPVELSGYYFISPEGKLCCRLEGKTAEVTGVFETEGGYIYFSHRIIKEK